MKYMDNILDNIREFLYSKNDDVIIDYDNMTINYNECGDTYYIIYTYSNNEIKSILVCAKNDNISAFVEFYIVNDDLYTTLENIVNVAEETEERLNKQFEKKLKELLDK